MIASSGRSGDSLATCAASDSESPRRRTSFITVTSPQVPLFLSTSCPPSTSWPRRCQPPGSPVPTAAASGVGHAHHTVTDHLSAAGGVQRTHGSGAGKLDGRSHRFRMILSSRFCGLLPIASHSVDPRPTIRCGDSAGRRSGPRGAGGRRARGGPVCGRGRESGRVPGGTPSRARLRHVGLWVFPSRWGVLPVPKFLCEGA